MDICTLHHILAVPYTYIKNSIYGKLSKIIIKLCVYGVEDKWENLDTEGEQILNIKVINWIHLAVESDNWCAFENMLRVRGFHNRWGIS
jgi:hypothetical protein